MDTVLSDCSGLVTAGGQRPAEVGEQWGFVLGIVLT